MNKNAKNNSTVVPEAFTNLDAKKIEELTPIVAANLNKLLKDQNISAKKLAQMTMYSESAISKYRTGKQFPSIPFFCQLNAIFGIPIDDFFFKEINCNGLHSQMVLSDVEEAEKALYRKFCGTYLVYFLNTSDYKGRDKNPPEKSLLYGILTISEDKSITGDSTYSCIAVLGLKDRALATKLKKTVDSMQNYSDIENFISNEEELVSKTYYGDFELSTEHAFLTLTHGRKDKALIILHRVNTNKKEYIGGMGTINSVSKGREPMPTIQYIAFSRYPISLSVEEIHHQLLLSHPTYKADANVKELISLFKKTYMRPDPDGEIHTELEKELIIKVNLERYVKMSLTNNMFRYAKISERDDGAWYDLLKEVSITTEDVTDNSSAN